MTAAALLVRDTAIADIRRRGKTPHQYGDTKTDGVILRTKVSSPTLRKMTEDVFAELTERDRLTGERELSTISAGRVTEVLALIAQGYRRMSIAEVAAVIGKHWATAQRCMAELRELGVLRARELGRKGESVSTYEIGPRGMEMLRDAYARITEQIARWARWRAERKGRKGSARTPRLVHDQHSKTQHRESPLPSGQAQRSRPPGPPPVAEVLIALHSTANTPHTAVTTCEHNRSSRSCIACARALMTALRQ